MITGGDLSKRIALGSEKGDPVLQAENNRFCLLERLTFSRVLIASTLSLSLCALASSAQTNDSKKPGLEPVAATSPASKSAMGEPLSKQSSAQSLPKPETAKSASGSKAAESGTKESANQSSAADKSALPFPLVSSDSLASLSGVQFVPGRQFPSAIDIHGSAAGVLLHARRETRYDLLSPLSIWLEDGPLLVSVRRPSEMVLVATKFGDICVTAGGDALVERSSDDDVLRIVNLCTSGDTVFLNMHDKLWTESPWGRQAKSSAPSPDKEEKKGKKSKGKSRSKSYETVDSGAISIAPGYELLIGAENLTIELAKPTDSVGRRDFRVFESGKILIDEISVDNLTQLHDLIKNLNNHGERAGAVFNEVMKNAAVLKSKQGESGFEKNVPKPVEPKRKPPSKVKPPLNKPKPTSSGSGDGTKAPAATTGNPPTKPAASSSPPAAKPNTVPVKPAASSVKPEAK